MTQLIGVIPPNAIFEHLPVLEHDQFAPQRLLEGVILGHVHELVEVVLSVELLVDPLGRFVEVLFDHVADRADLEWALYDLKICQIRNSTICLDILKIVCDAQSKILWVSQKINRK